MSHSENPSHKIILVKSRIHFNSSDKRNIAMPASTLFSQTFSFAIEEQKLYFSVQRERERANHPMPVFIRIWRTNEYVCEWLVLSIHIHI